MSGAVGSDTVDVHELLKGLAMLIDRDDTDDLLEQLQKAAEDHQRILERQAELIRRLRAELKEMKRE